MPASNYSQKHLTSRSPGHTYGLLKRNLLLEIIAFGGILIHILIIWLRVAKCCYVKKNLKNTPIDNWVKPPKN